MPTKKTKNSEKCNPAFGLHDRPFWNVETFLKKAIPFPKKARIRSRKNRETFEFSCSFDTEASSFYVDEKKTPKSKRACLYAWVIGINGYVLLGRTYEEMISAFNRISTYLDLSGDKRVAVFYVHNLAYDFQFIRKRFKWVRVFSLDSRKPVEAITDRGICFRCSYQLSGYSLDYLGAHMLHKYPVRKMVGDLDYDLIRHQKTPLTGKEVGYIVNDGLVVMAYIQELIEREGKITALPYTKTGFVRKACRKKCFYPKVKNHHTGGKEYLGFYNLVHSIDIQDMFEYNQLKRVFAGGFTHSNARYQGKILFNVASEDLTSAYPFCMVAYPYPMGNAIKANPANREEFNRWIRNYLCVFDIAFKNIRPRVHYEHIISSSKCRRCKNALIDNGRIVRADYLETTLTNIDLESVERFYVWDEMSVGNLRAYPMAYLPTPYVETVLDFYRLKTTLKGVAGKEAEYMKSKEDVNSLYGMMVTDPLRATYVYDQDNEGSEWDVEFPDYEQALHDYNESGQRFLAYQWGVFVTSYCRRIIYNAILELKDDYKYSDTDSVKFTNYEAHKGYFEKWNGHVRALLRKSADHHHLDFDSYYEPSTIKGEKKLLGAFDYEGTMSRFVTLGAKRYLYEEDGKIVLTCAGVGKRKGADYLVYQFGKVGAFENFKEGLVFPARYEVKQGADTVYKSATGKLIHTYIDMPTEGIVTDYLGKSSRYSEESSIHMEATGYELSISYEYQMYLAGVRMMTSASQAA